MLENPDRISKAVLGKGLDANTAFEILSIDIADIDVGDNVGAKLAADRAKSDTQRFQAEAEQRRAMAVAHEQENIAKQAENRAAVILAEAEVPRANCRRIPQREPGGDGLLQDEKRAGRHGDAGSGRQAVLKQQPECPFQRALYSHGRVSRHHHHADQPMDAVRAKKAWPVQGCSAHSEDRHTGGPQRAFQPRSGYR